MSEDQAGLGDTAQSPDKPSIPSAENKTGLTLAERHPDWPPIKLKFYFSRHGSREDIEGIESLKRPDILLYEAADGNFNSTDYQELANIDRDKMPSNYLEKRISSSSATSSDGKIIPTRGTQFESIWRLLYGTKTVVGHIDLRPGDPVNAQELQAILQDFSVARDFDETLTEWGGNIKIAEQMQNQREEIMTDRFEKEMEEILRIHPELKDKEELNILFTMGSYHTSLYHKFKELGIDTDRDFPDKLHVYSWWDQAQREFSLATEGEKVEKKLDRDLLAKVYLEIIMKYALDTKMREKVRRSDQQVLYLRQLASHFTTAEIESFHEQFFPIGQDPNLVVDLVNRSLAEKKLPSLPSNNEELANRLTKEQESTRRHQESARGAQVREKKAAAKYGR